MEEQIVVKLDSERKVALSVLAKKQGLNLSNLIRMVLYEKLDQQAPN